jgi:hypothetical protein
MSGLLWFFVGWFFLMAVMNVAQVGKARKPLRAAVAAGVVVIDALIIAAIFYFGWGLS